MSDTAPRNQRALTHHAPKPQPRPALSGERLWVLYKGGARIRAELRDDTRAGAGAELQLFRDDAFFYSRRHLSREIALAEAAGYRQEKEADGWQE